VSAPAGFEIGGERTAFAHGAFRVTQIACIVAAVFALLRAIGVGSQVATVCLFALDLLHLISVIAFLAWFRRAHANLVALGLPLRYGSTAAVAMFFIPIANLLLPTVVVGEVWSASAPTARLRGRRGIGVEVVRWWSVYIVASFLYGAGRYLSMDDDLRGVSGALLVFGCVAGSVAAQMTSTLIAHIDRREATLLTQPLELPVASSRKSSWRDYLFPVSRALEDELTTEERDST
jgi:Domain of unknown function (DUF4328)